MEYKRLRDPVNGQINLNYGKVAVFDIDGTIINSGFVSEYLDECGSYAEVYNKYGNQNKPIASTICLVNQLRKQGVHIVFLTAREESDIDRTHEHISEVIEINYTLRTVGLDDGVHHRKAKVIEEINETHDIVLFMDDNELNRLEVSKLGIVVLDVI